jgi:hypothetical protein
MLEAAKGFRRLKAKSQLPQLRAALLAYQRKSSRPPALAQIVRKMESISAFAERVIPTLTDQNRCAQSRSPIDMMRQGCSVRRFQWWQQ